MRNYFLSTFVCFFLFGGTTTVQAQSPEVSCIARDYSTPSRTKYESYLRDLTGADDALISYRPTGYSGVVGGLWANFVDAALARYRERDLFCILGSTVTMQDLRPVLATQGGSATFLVPHDFKLDLILDAPDLMFPPTKDGPLSNPSLIRMLKSTIRNGISIRASGCNNVGSARASEKCYEQAAANFDEASEKVNARLEPYEAAYTAPLPGEISVIRQNGLATV